MIFNFSIRVFCLFFYFSIFFKGVGTQSHFSVGSSPKRTLGAALYWKRDLVSSRRG